MLLLLGSLLPASASAQAPPPGGPVAPVPAPTTEVIVRFAPGTDARERGEARADADVRRQAVLPLAGAEVVDPEAGVGVAQAVRDLERDPRVLYAEPNASRVAFATPNDRFFGQQWGLQNTGQVVANSGGTPGADIDAPAAWDVTTGSRDVVVGVIDSGADTAHPDLAANLWRNPGESGAGQATNGIDDDRNGFVDDVNGWDFAEHDAQPLDAEGHGTHVAGTVGARGGNAIGVTGVAQSSSLMVLRSLGADGSGSVADVVTAYAYAARNGARVVNLSLGGNSGSQTERDALAAASGVLFVAAAGNDGADNDTAGTFPCNYELVNVVCVGASDRNDALASFSNRGKRTVDLAAPGVNIASTYLNGTYVYLSGTSMATPHVTGVAALALARAPGLTVPQLRDVLLSSVDPIFALRSVTVTGGRLNAARAVRAAGSFASAPPGGSTVPAPGPSGSTGSPPPEPSAPVAAPPASPPAADPPASPPSATPPPASPPSATPPPASPPSTMPPPASPPSTMPPPASPPSATPPASAPESSTPPTPPETSAPSSPAPAPPGERSASSSPAPVPPSIAKMAAAAMDRTAPGLAVRAARTLRSRTLRASGLRATVTCSQACRLSASLTLDATTARKLGLRSRRIAFTSATVARAGRRVIVLRPTATVRARLRGRGRATLLVTARNAAGGSRTRSQQVTLR